MPTHAPNTEYKACPVCSGPINFWRAKKVRDETYRLDLCSACGYAFVNPRPSLSFLMEYYSSLGETTVGGEGQAPDLQSILADEQDDPNATIDARRVLETIKALSKGGGRGKFLDVGCGYGFFSKAALEAGFEVTALELSVNSRGITQEMTGLEPVACSFEEFGCPPGSLSVVCMSQILEHALDVNLWINKTNALLANRGIVAIALPNYGSIFRMLMGENEPFISPPEHLNFFSPRSLSRLLARHGFEVKAIQWVSRIPRRTFEKRLPKLGRPLIPIIRAASTSALKVIDILRLGMIINVYARKVRASSED